MSKTLSWWDPAIPEMYRWTDTKCALYSNQAKDKNMDLAKEAHQRALLGWCLRPRKGENQRINESKFHWAVVMCLIAPPPIHESGITVHLGQLGQVAWCKSCGPTAGWSPLDAIGSPKPVMGLRTFSWAMTSTHLLGIMVLAWSTSFTMMMCDFRYLDVHLGL